MENFITSNQYVSSCYVRNEYGNTVVVHEKQVTVEEKSREVISTKQNLKYIVNPKRKIYVTKPQYRNHEFKKETESLDKVDMYIVDDRTTVDALKQILGLNKYKRMSLRDVCNSPYIYNADLSIESLIRTKYIKTAKHPILPLSKGSMDIETSVISDTQEINCFTFIAEENIYTVALDTFVYKYTESGKKVKATVEDLYESAYRQLDKYLNPEGFIWPRKSTTKRKFKLHAYIAPNEKELIKWVFDKVHEEKMDFICIWNMEFDINKIISRLKALSCEPKDFFCHPSVPDLYKYIYFKFDKKKVDHIIDKWHWVNCTSYSQYIDSMLLYGRIRKIDPKKPSYKLDAISSEEIGDQKLEFENAGHYEMQTTKFIDYWVYNIKDTLLLQLMEWQNNDIDNLYHLTDNSPLSDFSKQSIMLKNTYAQFLELECNEVFATTGSEMKTKFDSLIGKVGGAVLKADNTIDIGLKCLAERPNAETNVLIYAADEDYGSIYPSTASAYGISKETKKYTCVKIENTDTSRIEPLFGGLASPDENAVWICNEFLNLPDYKEMLKLAGEQLIMR